jgi:hypothetical protein
MCALKDTEEYSQKYIPNSPHQSKCSQTKEWISCEDFFLFPKHGILCSSGKDKYYY